MQGIDQLLRLIDIYRAAREVSDARVSTLVFNDGSRIAELRSGRDIGTRRLERAVLWFAENWPAGIEWPDGIERPLPDTVAA